MHRDWSITCTNDEKGNEGIFCCDTAFDKVRGKVIFFAQTTRMAFFQSPNYGYQPTAQQGQRDLSQPFCPIYQNSSGFDANPLEGQQHHDHYWNPNYYQEYGTASSTELPPYGSPFHPQSHYQQEGYHLHHYQPHSGSMVPPPPLEECEEDRNIELSLENKGLWEKFSQFATEMIITRAGRLVCNSFPL